jgi:hypothetical protein
VDLVAIDVDLAAIGSFMCSRNAFPEHMGSSIAG